jgi:hypothetical protein
MSDNYFEGIGNTFHAWWILPVLPLIGGWIARDNVKSKNKGKADALLILSVCLSALCVLLVVSEHY